MKFLIKIFCLNLCLSAIVLPAQHRAVGVNETMKRAMSFDMKPILERYKRDFKVADELVVLHHQELMRYLVMCALSPQESIEMMSKDIDNLWHTFILFTKNYARFCKHVTGRFIHHVPNVNKQVNNLKEKAAKFVSEYNSLFQEAPSLKIWNLLCKLSEQSDCMDCMGD